MNSEKLRFRSLSHCALLALLLIGAMVVEGYGQDPSGRSTGSSTKGKKPSNKKPSARPEPQPFTVTLTVLTDPPESTVLINGEERGRTNAEGKIQFDKLPLGHYSVSVSKEGFNTALRGFQAGSESPTLVFKLTPKMEDIVTEFNSLTSAGKLMGPDSPNAFDLLKRLAEKYPDNADVARMRGVLAARLSETAAPVISKTTASWRAVTREELVKANEAAKAAAELKGDDKRIQAQAAYLRAVLGLRDLHAGAGGASSSPEDSGGQPSLADIRAGLERAVELDDSWPAARYHLGLVLLNSGDASGAEAAFLKVTQLEPRWPAGYVGLGSAYHAGNKHKEAIETFRKAIELNPSLHSAHAGLGLARAARGELKEAIKDVQKAMQLDPSSGLPHRNLGIIYSQSKKGKEGKKELTQAIDELKKAIAKNSSNLEFRNSDVEKMIADLEARRGTK